MLAVVRADGIATRPTEKQNLLCLVVFCRLRRSQTTEETQQCNQCSQGSERENPVFLLLYSSEIDRQIVLTFFSSAADVHQHKTKHAIYYFHKLTKWLALLYVQYIFWLLHCTP